jgi:hypothetical protein
MVWKLALAQHPMYFLIKEDELCAERTPPWGAPDAGAYIERLRQNFAALRQNPHLKVGFEWSGLELELLAADAPTVFQEMLALAGQGQITFYNGTYSQPHLQTLSAEANYRQFEFGARVYRDLCRRQVLVYAHQETSFNEQTPQLLKAFGIRYGVLPHFMATLVMEGGELIFHAREGTMFVQGSEFARWRGLDGTIVETYLEEPPHRPLQDWLAVQAVKGQLRVPPIIVDSPDLISIDEAWLAERSQFDFVLLDEALPERVRQAPPRFDARLYANWSYIEGIRAEELARANWLAERAVLRTEAICALAFVLSGRQSDGVDSIWKTILTTQHHDVYCFCAPDLKRKSIGWLRQAEQQANRLSQAAVEALLPRIGGDQTGAEQLVIFNTVPQPVASPVTIEVPSQWAALLTAGGEDVPCEVVPAEDGHSHLTFVARANALGYTSFILTRQGEAATTENLADLVAFENLYYRAVVQPDATFMSLQIAPTGLELLDTRVIRGGQIAANESPGPGSEQAGTPEASKTERPVARGPDLVWTPDGPARVRRSSIGVRLTAAGHLGSQVQVRASVQFYRQLPWIDLTWEFDFDQASLGSFFDDDSKLRVQFPLAGRGQIHHDIAFGVTTSLEDRPFFPASWVDISDGQAGLAYLHQGTLKHWVKDNVLTNLFAWGEDTDAIGNRLGRGRWPKAFDQRLTGRHTIRAALYPHAGDWRAADVVGVARSFVYPPLAFLTTTRDGQLPASLDVFELSGSHLAATAIMVEARQVMCRFYSYASQPQPVELRLEKMKLAGLSALAGDPLDEIGPFQIGQLRFEPQA